MKEHGDNRLSFDVERSYRRFGVPVLRRCEFLLGDPELAKDAMHDVFVKLATKRTELREDAVGWLLYRMATNALPGPDPPAPPAPRDALGGALADDRVDGGAGVANDRVPAARPLLNRQKPLTRTIAVLHFVDGMTIPEVAKVLGMSVSGVNERIRTLRRHARKLEEIAK